MSCSSEVYYIDEAGYITRERTEFDGDGTITTTSSGNIILAPSEGGMTMVGTNFVSSHDVDSNSDLGIEGEFECNGRVWLDSVVTVNGILYTNYGCIHGGSYSSFSHGTIHWNDKYMYFGTTVRCGIAYNTTQTPGAFVVTSPTTSNNIIIMDHYSRSNDFGYAQRNDPTLFLVASGTTSAQYAAISHRGSNVDIESGLGAVAISVPTSSDEPSENSRFWIVEDSGSAVFYLKQADGTVVSGTWTAL